MISPFWLFTRKHWLPGRILHKKPYLIASYDYDFLKQPEKFGAVLPKNEKVFCVLMLGWQHEFPENVREFSQKYKAAQAILPNWEFLVLANTPKEEQLLAAEGVNIHYCHQNAFLNESRYPLISHPKKKYDAIYIARISPFKRHALAAGIPTLHLIGNHSGKEETYFQDTLHLLSQARYDEKVLSFRIYRSIQEACCGLCLSKIEGAMFVSAEYQLSGIPVVNTPNIGGRDLLLAPYGAKMVEPTPEAVADGVRYWVENPVNPQKLRENFLELAQPHREKFRQLIRDFTGLKMEYFPHKLGIRCRQFPWERLLYGLPR